MWVQAGAPTGRTRWHYTFSDSFFVLEVEGSGLASVVVEFGDGYTETFNDPVFCHQFLSPGLVHMTTTVLDVAKAPYPASSYLKVHLPIIGIKRLCPVVVLQGEVFDCEFAIYGTGTEVSVDIEGIHSFNLTLADATVWMVGPSLDQTTQPPEPDVQGVFIKSVDRMTEDVILVGWEVVVKTQGLITLMVYRPQPVTGQQFCPRTLGYIDALAQCLQQPSLRQHKCIAGETFSFTKRSCFDTGTNVIIDPDASQPEVLTYTEVSRFNFTTDEPGMQFIPLLEEERLELQAGDLVGFLSRGISVIRHIQPQVATDGDIYFQDSGAISVSPNPSPSTRQYLYRAVAVQPSVLHVKGMYAKNSTLGPRNIALSAKNAVSSKTLATSIRVSNVIDNVTLTVTGIAETYETVGLEVDYDGKAVAVEWSMGDGTIYNTTENSTIYQWKIAGIYNVTVRVINYYNSESETKLIIVQERILGLNWTTPGLGNPIPLSSEAVLKWRADNGTDVQYVFEFDWNLGGSLTNLTFGGSGVYVPSLPTSDWALSNFRIEMSENALMGVTTFYPDGHGNLSVSLHIFNLVSNMRIFTSLIIQSVITEFNVLDVPPQTFGDDIFLVYEFMSGSDIVVDLTIDGHVIRGTCITTYLAGKCMLGYQTEYFEDGEYSIELSAYNDISGPAAVVRSITIEVPFDSRNLSVEFSPAYTIPTGFSLNIAFGLTQGSNVNYRVDFGDGSSPKTGLSSCFPFGGSDKRNVSHVFSNPGRYISEVHVQNLVSSASYSAEVRVQNPVTFLSLDKPIYGDVIGIEEGGAFKIIFIFDIRDGSSGLPPTDATAAFFFQDGFYENQTLDAGNTGLYPITQMLQVPGHGLYNGHVKVSNLVSEVEFGLSVEVDELIENLQIVPVDGFDLVVDEELHFNLSVSWGSRITFTVDFGDGTSTSQFSEKRGIQVSHVYGAIGELHIQVNAINSLGTASARELVRLFYRVKGFFLQMPILNSLPPSSTLTIEFLLYIEKSINLPNNATVSIIFDDGESSVYALATTVMSRPELNTDTAVHVASFPMTYNKTGKFTMAARIANPVSSMDLAIEFWIYEVISDLETFVKYNHLPGGNISKGDPTFDQEPFESDGLYIPIDRAVVLIATFASGNDLTFTWDFGETPSQYSVTHEPREIYWYRDPGIYTITLNVSNPISHMVANITIHVQVPVRDVMLTLLDIGDKTSNVTMYFEVQTSLLGMDACYRVDFQDSQIAPVIFFGSETVCRETYRTEISYSQYPFIFEPLDLLGMWEESRLGNFNVTNIYDRHGNYKVSVTGSNIVSESTFILPQYVAKPDCFVPKVSVNESNLCDGILYKCARNTYFRVYLASSQITVDSDVSLNCKSSNKAWYDWSISFLGHNPRTEGRVYDLPDDVVTAGFSLGSLTIKPASLRYGWYHFELNVSMYQEYPPIFAIDSTYIRVKPSPLEVHIYGGEVRTISHNNTITLDAERLTYDPDVPRGSPNPNEFKFVWLCRRKSYYSTRTGNTTDNIEPFEVWDRFYESLKKDDLDNKNDEIDASDALAEGIVDRGGCFGLSQEANIPKPGGKLSFTTGRITFSTVPMYYNMQYELKVAVIKGNRVGEDTQILDVKEGRPPILQTFCKVNCKKKLNPSNRYSLESQEAFGGNNFFSLYYKWEIYSQSSSGQWDLEPEDSWIEFARTPPDRANFVIEPGFFKEKMKYRLKLIGSRNPDLSNSGSVVEEVLVNDRPSSGTCSVTPKEGQVLTTDFDIWCEGWVDVPEDLPLSYTFKVNGTSASSMRTLHASTKPRLVQPTKLNQGLPENNCTVQITIDVTDSWGCFETTYLEVKVKPPNISTDVTSELRSIQTSMETLFADAKKESAANLVIATADFLNTEAVNNRSSGSNTEDVDSDISQERIKMRENMAGLLSDTQVSTVEGVQQLSSAMAAVTKIPEEVTQEARTRLLGSMEGYSKVLQNNSQSNDPISVEMLESATAVCMEVVENIVEATHTAQVEEEPNGPGVVNMQRSEEVVDRLASAISAKMVLGQNDIEVQSSKSTLILAKSPVLWISNKNFSAGDGNYVNLPLYEDLFQDTDNYTAVTQKFIMRDRSTKVLATSGQQVKSMVVSLTLINDTDQSPMQVAHTASPIEISIVRKEEHLIANGSSISAEVYVNRTAPVGGKMVVHQIEIPPNNALSLEVKSLGTDGMQKGLAYDVILYIFFRQGGHPSLAVHDLNCTLRQHVIVEEDYTPTNASWDLGFNAFLSNDSLTRCFFASATLDNLRDNASFSLYYGVNHEVLSPYSAAETDPMTGSGLDSSRFHPMYYALTSSLYSCLAIGDKESEWSTDGCVVGENSTDMLTQCFCDHLTMFGGGFRIPINHIDLSDSAFLKLDENPVVFIFMICCLSLYLLVIIWARKADKRDIVKAGIAPLPDNDPHDRFLYEVTVYTGLKRNAGTTANVTLLMSGELGDSVPRVLHDPKRKVFQAGGVDSFLLATPVSLGNLMHVRIWHDNKGKRPAWYLARIMIKDLCLDRTFYFMANRWLAVEEDDGMIERVIPVAGRSELTSFGHLFFSKTRRNLSDAHIWFSVFARPVKSKFTRVQRATCCLSLLFCTMMANIFFYNIDFQEVAGTQVVYVIGPISFSFGQVVTGVISSLMVLPINLMVVQLFRYSRPVPACSCNQKTRVKAEKSRRMSTVSDASRVVSDLEKELAHMDAQESARSVPSISLSLMNSQSSLLHSQALNAHLEYPTSATSSPREDQAFKPVLGFKKTRQIKKGLELPWQFCCLAWLLVLTSVAVAFWLTIEVAGQFGPDKAMEWLTSMCFSLIQDIFFIQPFKVLLLALFFSLVIRDPEKEENSNLAMAPHLQDDEEWLHDRMTAEELQDPAKMARLKQLKEEVSAKNLAPLHPEDLAEARDIRVKEIKMHKIIREIVFYLIFLHLTMLICFGDRDPSVFYVNKSMTDMFVGASYNGRMLFTKIRGRDHFWNYTENVFFPSLYSYDWYNGEPDESGRRENVLADNSMHLVGRVRFRQLRIQKESCITPEILKSRMKNHDCRAPYSIADEDATSYDAGWQPLNVSDPPNYANRYMSAWKYNHWYDVSSFPYYGKHAFYNGGGYIVEFGDSLEENLRIAADLQQDMWVDQHTRAVFLEFVVYNANVNMYSTSFLLVEFLPQGGATPYPYFWTIRLDRYIGAFAYFVLAGQIVYTLFIIYFLVRELRNLFREKRQYFDSVWNLCEVCILALAISSIVFYLYRMFVGWDLMEQWRTQPKVFLNFHFVAYWDQLYGYLSGFVLFLVNVKFIRLLRFNRRLLLFSMTLRQCGKDLAYYGVVFCLVFGAYALFAYAIFHLHLENFSTFVGTLETLFSTILGKFEFQDMISVHSFLGPTFFFTYVVIIVFVMINMFLSIINETFGKVRHDNEAVKNELEIVDFMLQRFKRWSSLSERRFQKPAKREDYIESIDPKDLECKELKVKLTTMVDRLNQFIRAEKKLTKSGRRIYLSN
ncbi:uncharacterized protein LOC110980349 [Acanthaster planci]|uniref:Uncharacterized protein LOC110980349 n=1 Tax=Acanthaster planci TaxID=133434 RepID=A0A8B7YJ49_ACAPL|nr:uncharacterized protein LOC110980349 [Acanthaster planci]